MAADVPRTEPSPHSRHPHQPTQTSSLSIDSDDTPSEARALSIRERASIQIVGGMTEEYLANARKTMDADAAAQFEQGCRELYDQMARISITSHWARYYDFGAGRVPRFLQELADSTGDKMRRPRKKI